MKTQTQTAINKELLTGRELEVLKLIGQGYTSKEIGGLLGISDKTVDAHRENIKKKLRLNTIAGLSLTAFNFGLVTLDQAR